MIAANRSVKGLGSLSTVGSRNEPAIRWAETAAPMAPIPTKVATGGDGVLW